MSRSSSAAWHPPLRSPRPTLPESNGVPLKASLSIVIVNWNGRVVLQRCLAALREQSDQDFELVLVDNGSTDDSVVVLEQHFPEATLVQLPENLGFAEGCNRGIERCHGTWILTLNNDTEPAEDFITMLRAAADAADGQVGMLQARIELASRGRLNSTGVLVFRDGSAHDRDFDAPLEDRQEGDEIFCTTAGAGLYRRTMLDEARLATGYFDKSYFMYFEDVDLGWRCRLLGWSAHYVPEAVTSHAFQASSKKRGRHFVTIQCMQNRIRTLLKNASFKMIARALPRTASDLLWLLQHAGGRALADWFEAAGSALRQRGAITAKASVSRRDIEGRWVINRAS